jgi:O-antigen/teichoic acid export membrane protein
MLSYGAAFAGRGRVLTFAALSAALLAVETPMGNAMAAYGRMWAGALMNFGWALCLLAATWYLVGRAWGADGLACAHLVAYAVHGLWATWYVARLVRQRYPN